MSNLIGGDDGAKSRLVTDPRPTCRPAVADEVVPALQLILGVADHPAEESQAADFMRFTAHRGVNLNETWIAELNGRMIWAVLPMVSPGRTMLVLGASAQFAGGRSSAVVQTLERVCDRFADKGVQLAQVLLDPLDAPTIDAYLAAGFQQMAELIA